MLTRKKLVSKLQAAVGQALYGEAVVAEAAAFGDRDRKHDRDAGVLHERPGIFWACKRFHCKDGEETGTAFEAGRIVIAEKALAAIR